MDLGAPRAQTRRQQVRGGVVHCSVKTLGARENNVQVKDAQTWVMLKTSSYKNKVASFAFQNGLLFNYSAEVCVEYQCWFQQYKILNKSLQLLSLHVLTLRSGICCQVHQVPCCLRIYINLHLTDRELLPETEMAVLVCATMHLQPYCGIVRLACPAFFRFLLPQINPTAYDFCRSGGRQCL